MLKTVSAMAHSMDDEAIHLEERKPIREGLLTQARAALHSAYGHYHRWSSDGGYESPEDWLAALVDASIARPEDLADLPASARAFFVDDYAVIAPAIAALGHPVAPMVLREFSRRLRGMERAAPSEIAALFRALRGEFKDQHGLRGREVMEPLRAGLTGRMDGPCLEVAVCLLGLSRCLERVARYLEGNAEGDS